MLGKQEMRGERELAVEQYIQVVAIQTSYRLIDRGLQFRLTSSKLRTSHFSRIIL